MLGFKRCSAKSIFNAKLLITFGKLDQQDIAYIKGCSDRLVVRLMDRYGWGFAYAQTQVAHFNSDTPIRKTESS
jgi:hypothetical protein